MERMVMERMSMVTMEGTCNIGITGSGDWDWMVPNQQLVPFSLATLTRRVRSRAYTHTHTHTHY